MIKKVQKIQGILEAVQVTHKNHQEIIEWVGGSKHGDGIRLETISGISSAYPGEWLVKDRAGRIHIYKPEIFEMTFEEVVDD